MTLSCAVLAGGRSTRMGTDKSLLFTADIVRRLMTVSDDVFAVAKVPIEGVRTVVDDNDIASPLVGVLTALRHARHDAVFVCACDMPLVSTELVMDLASLLGPHDAVVPLRDGHLEPLHAVWSKSAVDAVANALADGERSVRRVLAALDALAIEVPSNHASFTNVNTPADLATLRTPPGRSDVPLQR